VSDESGAAVVGRIFDIPTSGAPTPLAGEFLVNTTTTGIQVNPSVTALGGGFVATWATDSGLVVAQVFDRSGAKVGVEIAVNAAATNLATSDIRPSIAPLASGGFVVTWEVFSFTSGVDIVGRVFNASGTPVTAQFPVTSFAVENRQDFPSVAALPDGGFFVTWRSTNQDNPGQAGSGFFGQRFDASGAKVGGEFQINQTVLGEQIPTTAGDYALALLAGDLVAVWQSSPPGTLGDVFARTFAPYNGTFEISPLTPNADEGSGFTFTITRLGGTGNATIQYNTADDSATAPGDYTATSGSVELAPGASATITVAGVEDTIDEASETFTVTLSNPTNGAAITDGMGVATATILDNDPTPTVSISDAQVTEGGELSFDVTLSAASGQTVTVDYATANGTAAAPDDYTAVTSTTLKFLPGRPARPSR
jgi:hypothetical protein